LELKQIFQIRRNFDEIHGWNRYENCKTSEEILDFMKHYVLVTVEELGEICRIRKEVERDKQILDVKALGHNL